MKDAQRAYTKQSENEAQDKVYISENIEESDSENDSSGERQRKLNGEGQSSKQGDKKKHLWLVNVNVENPSVTEKLADTSTKVLDPEVKSADCQSKFPNEKKVSESLEIFIPNDNIIQTQESQNLWDDVPIEEMLPQGREMGDVVDMSHMADVHIQPT
jgi:hypothetical protein